MWIHVCGSTTTSFFSGGRGTCICLEAVSPVQGYLNLTGSGPHAALRLELAEERGGEGHWIQCQEGLMFPNRDLGLWPTVVP